MDITQVKSPKHYTEGRKFEPKDVIRDWGLNFNLGSALKYIARAGRKDDIVQDLRKAQEYIDFEIQAIEAECKKKDTPDNSDCGCTVKCTPFNSDASGNFHEKKIYVDGVDDQRAKKFIDDTIADIVKGIAGVELIEQESKDGGTIHRIKLNGEGLNIVGVYNYIDREFTDRVLRYYRGGEV